MYKYKDHILTVLFLLSACWIPLNDFGCTLNQLLCVVIVGCSMLSGLKVSLMQFAFFLPFMSATAFPIFGVNFHAINMLEAILIIRVLVGQGVHSTSSATMNRSWLIGLVVAVIACQLPAVIVYGQNVGNIMKLIINASLFYVVYTIVKARFVQPQRLLLIFSFGIIASCILGFWYHPPLEQLERFGQYDMSEGWMRYKGLWTDPNFLGMFALIGSSVCATYPTENRWFKSILLCCAIILCFIGSLTLSRMYIMTFILLIALYGMNTVAKSRWTVIGLLLLVAVAVPFTMDVIDNISANRSYTESGITNGRVDRTLALLSDFSLHPFAVFFGVGYENHDVLEGVKAGKTVCHNTYADLLMQFGLFGLGLLWGMLIMNIHKMKDLLKFLFKRESLYFVALLICSGGLSTLKYEYLYFITAIFLASYVVERNTEYYEIVE